MVQNADRRTRLLDAGVEVLAARGGRGLTFSAVDAAAGLPPGTATNFFASRGQLVTELAAHVFVRLAPDPVEAADRLAEPSRRTELDLMHWLLDRAAADRAAHLALIELRLEATRDPAVASIVTPHFAANLTAATADHVDGGFPGDRSTALVLYLAMTGLLLEHLTLPGLLDEQQAHAAVSAVVGAVVPE